MTPQGPNHYWTLSLHIYGWGKVDLYSDIEKTGRSDHFPEGTGCSTWFCKLNVIIELQSAFKNSSINNNDSASFLCY